MNTTDVKNLNITYIGGGSRGWAWTLMTDLAKETELAGTVRLYDINREAAERNELIGNRLSARNDVPGKWKYVVKDTLKDALSGTDFVIISILPKTFDEMAVDVHAPEKYGIFQSVGDTAGPGGMIRALRTIPMFAEIAEAIRDFAPDAWVINYTNPMSLCVKTLYTVFPQIKAFGCCHEVFGTQKTIAEIAMRELGLKDIERDDIHVNVLGINHFTWFDKVYYKNTDLIPVISKFVDEHYEEGLDKKDDNWMNSYFACAHRIKFDLFKKYGLMAAAGDRHLAEFMPGEIYLKDPGTVKEWKFSLTPVDWRKEDLKQKLARSERLAEGKEEIDLSIETGEEGVELMKCLLGLTNRILNVNIPNYAGQIPNLPTDAVVETNALFERNSIRPVYAGPLPEDVKALIMPHIDNHERILKVALAGNKDRETVYEAFANDPQVKGRLTDVQIKDLVNEMMDRTL